MATLPPDRPYEAVPLEEEMQRSYLDYAMSVIVARALPDVRDGLKPVHRRILHAMREGGYDYNRPTRKSSRIVGDVMGKYHPHGGDAIYDALVRMAQDFSMRLPLIDGQGNFGSMDGDPPAAMRYTEARLAQAADALLADIDKDTVDFRPNYDDTDREPAVLPAQFPNLLVNGAGGIAVGMATNVPPHNLGEVIDACVALIDDPDLGFERLLELIPGPDFPTGGIILGQAGIRQAFATGRGSLVVRSKTHIEEVRKDRDAIIVTEIPYQVNKGRMQERMGELVRERKLEGIAEIRDESDRDGTRVVIEIKRDADPDIVLNQLFRHTPLQVTFGVNLVALSGGRPAQMNVRQVLELFLEFREEVIARRTAFDLARARERAHVLLGLAVAVANLDAIIALIRAAPDPASAREQLAAQDWPLGDVAPLLHLAEESVDGHAGRAGRYLPPLGAPGPGDPGAAPAPPDPARALQDHRRAEGDQRPHPRAAAHPALARAAARGAQGGAAERQGALRHAAPDHDRGPRLRGRHRGPDPEGGHGRHRDPARLHQAHAALDLSRAAPRRQGPGRHGDPRGRFSGAAVRRQHAYAGAVLLVRGPGLQAESLPPAAGHAAGARQGDDQPVPAAGRGRDHHRRAAAAGGRDHLRPAERRVRHRERQGAPQRARRFHLRAGQRQDRDGAGRGRSPGRRRGRDRAHSDVLLAARGGKCVRFPIGSVRVFRSRSSEGVRGMDLAEGDRVVSMSVLDHVELSIEERDTFLRYDAARRKQDGQDETADPDELTAQREAIIRAAREELGANRLAELDAEQQMILSLTVNGFGKRTSAFEYRVTNRGGQGIINIETSKRNGPVVAAFPVADEDQLMLVTDGGQVIRIPVDDIRIASRNTQGVRLFDVAGDEHVVSVARLAGAAEANGEEPDEASDDGQDGGDGAAAEPDAP